MSSTITILDRIMVPEGVIPFKYIKKRYQFDLFNESKCAKCDNLGNRPDDVCAACPQNYGNYKFFDRRTDPRGESIYRLPISDIIHVRRWAKHHDVTINDKARRRLPKMEHGLEFTARLFSEGAVDKSGTPRINQQKVLADWMRYRTGIMEAPPRSGKSALSIAAAIKVGVKTLIIAHEHHLLNQFVYHFYGSKERDIPRMTNAAKCDKAVGFQTVEVIDNISRILKTEADVALVTIHKLYRKRNDAIFFRKLSRHFGMVIIDEAHRAYAQAYAVVMSRLDIYHRLALTATTQRKDGRDRLNEMLLGPVTARTEVVTLTPTIELLRIRAKPPTDYSSWQPAIRWVSHNDTRNEEIVDEVFRRLKAGHRSIAIPVAHLAHMKKLVRMINNRSEDEGYGENLAVAFSSQTKRAEQEEILARADNPKRRTVLVPILSKFKEGLNLRALSVVIVAIPTSGDERAGAPMFRQMGFRCATPMPGKKTPVIVLLEDTVTMFRGQLQSLFWREVSPNSNNKGRKLYKVTPELYSAVKSMGIALRKGRGRKGYGGMALVNGGWGGST